jgi:cation transport ATPase
LVGGLELKSTHPLATALVNYASGCITDVFLGESDGLPKATKIRVLEGQGIRGKVEGK